MASKITFVFELDDSGRVKVDGLTQSFTRLDNEINKVSNDLKRQSGELKKTNKNLGQNIDKTGLAGATLVELSRTISDSNYGFRAMANNISQLSTLFITLIASSGGVVKGLKNLGKAFLGPLGFIVLLNAVIARFEFLDLQANKTKKGVDALSDSFEKTAVDLQVFTKLVDRGNLSNEELDRTLFAITKKYKDLNPEVDENGKLTEASRLAIDNKIKSLRKLAKAQAVRSELEKIESEQLDFNIRKEQALDNARAKAASDRLLRTTKTGQAVYRTEEEAEQIRQRRIERTRESFVQEGKDLEKRRQTLFKYLEDTDSANEAFGMEDRTRQEALTVTKVGLLNFEVDTTIKANAKIMKSDDERFANKKKNYDAELRATAELTNGLSILLGEQTAAGKAFAVATATIDTYVAANQALKDPTIPSSVAKGIMAAAIIAQGLANVKNILSTEVPGGATYSGGKSSGPSSQQISQPPVFNIVGQSGVNQLGQTIAAARSEPMRAYVVANDITNAQELENKIIQQSSLG